MVYLIEAENSLENYEGPVTLLVEVENKSNINSIINTEVTLSVKNNAFNVVKELPGVKIDNKTSVVILSDNKKRVSETLDEQKI